MRREPRWRDSAISRNIIERMGQRDRLDSKRNSFIDECIDRYECNRKAMYNLHMFYASRCFADRRRIFRFLSAILIGPPLNRYPNISAVPVFITGPLYHLHPIFSEILPSSSLLLHPLCPTPRSCHLPLRPIFLSLQPYHLGHRPCRLSLLFAWIHHSPYSIHLHHPHQSWVSTSYPVPLLH